MYNVNVCKTNCINSIYEFMRLVGRRDNPNKETLMYISYTSFHHQLGIYNQSCWELVY